MFTWICPKCGTEVPPSYSECPNCARPPEERSAAPAAPSMPPPARPARPAPPKAALPGVLVALLVAVVLVGLGAGAYFYLLPSSKTATPASKQPAPFEALSSFPSPKAKAHPLAKFIEIAGMRVTEDLKQKAQIKFLVVNHSGAELGDLTLAITLKPSTAKPEDKPVAVFTVKVASLRPYESREFNTSVKSELRAYELPDWQFLRAEFEITAPAVP